MLIIVKFKNLFLLLIARAGKRTIKKGSKYNENLEIIDNVPTIAANNNLN